MISAETIRSILETAVQAPSGENAQPWRFEVQGDRISIFNIPENDRSLYNFQQRASYIAHGAVIENIVIAASHYSLGASVTNALPSGEGDLVATITLAPLAIPKEDALYSSIPTRSTNRKIYKGGDISATILGGLTDSAKGTEGVTVKFVTDPEGIKNLATIASVNDTLLLENREIHDFFFSHVHWTLKEEEEKRSGFYIEVLELQPPANVLFKLFKHWPVMSVFNALGAAKMGAKENSKIYASASAMGIITIADEKTTSFINAGRVLQRLWLTATSNGLSMQPLTGVLFFHQRFEAGEGSEFSAEQKQAVEEAYKGIQLAFGGPQGTITMMFRVGYAEPPTASSLKKPPEIVNK